MTIKVILDKILDAHTDMILRDDMRLLKKAVNKYAYWMEQLRKKLEQLGIDWEE